MIWESVLQHLDSNVNDVLLVTNDSGFYESEELHRDLKDDLVLRSHSGNRVTLLRDYEAAHKYLDVKYDLKSALQEEEWARVSKAELAEEIPFDVLLNMRKDAIGAELVSDDWLFDGTYGEDIYFPWDLETTTVDILEAEYIGNGEWKIQGEAVWDTEVEYSDFNEPYYFAQKSESMVLNIEFTIYYDYSDKEVDHETIITNVTRSGVYFDESDPDDHEYDPADAEAV